MIYPDDAWCTTYHPLALFGKNKYDSYKFSIKAEQEDINNIEGSDEEDYDIKNYIYSNLA